MIAEKARVFGKDRAFGRLFHIALKSHQPFLARLVEKVVHHLERFEVSLFVNLRTFKDPNHAGCDLLENVQGICDQNSADAGAANNDQFGWLDKNTQVAVLHAIPADDCAEDNHDSDDGKHSFTQSGVSSYRQKLPQTLTT